MSYALAYIIQLKLPVVSLPPVATAARYLEAGFKTSYFYL